ncbi:hypothetical protein R69608_04942 [Paraburkholderia nemoris]|nr:hypothetical protein LMG22931_04063 [Paraburkholderia nemoris]CAE6802564.1 hypothetical protein R69619_05269 [Paraburkholderia nemoris]CAE6935890.1 hypothetical protein R69608_04942 [Paraburkholderia nemoris]
MAPLSQHAHRGAALAPIARVREFYRIARERWGLVRGNEALAGMMLQRGSGYDLSAFSAYQLAHCCLISALTLPTLAIRSSTALTDGGGAGDS